MRLSVSRRQRVLRVLSIASVLLMVALGSEVPTRAIPSSTGKQFLYWWNHQFLPQTADHVSVAHVINPDAPNIVNFLQGLGPGEKGAINLSTVLLNSTFCDLHPQWMQRWSDFSSAIAPLLSKVAVFQLDDEADLRAGSCYPGNPNGPTAMKNLVETMSTIVKTTPGWAGVKTWVNWGAEFRFGPVPVAQNVDWTSFDCYGPFDNCSGTGYSIPQLVDLLAAKLPNPATQSIFLVTDASSFLYQGLGRRTHESELFVRGLQYWQLAATHPRIGGMVGFIWAYAGPPGNPLYAPDPINSISDSAGLSTLYRYIGRNLLLGEFPSISTLSAPAQCIIPIGGSACTVNLSWTRTSGPNVGAFARLAGQVDAPYPLCPGATSCSVPAGVGDYLIELRENYWDGNSKLVWAQATEVRHGSGAPSGQITFTTPGCKLLGGHCLAVMTANVQNAPAAAFFIAGSPYALCGPGEASFCDFDGALAGPGVHSVTVQLRANAADANSALLDQRQIQVRICAENDTTCRFY